MSANEIFFKSNLYQIKGVVGIGMIRCSVVNILELILASLEMMRLICPRGQVGLFLCDRKQKG